MKRGLAAAALVAGATTSILAAPPAMADTENCVTHAEYDRTDFGMNPSEVEAVYDVYGTYAGEGDNGYWRQYRTCWAPGVREVVVRFSWNTGNSYDWFVRDA